jgi:hypothetical protein
MAQGFSKADLVKFLDYLADKGLMKGTAIASRKAAVNAFLGILKPEEAEDLSNLNLDEVALRFANLKGSKFKPESMRVYKSRVSSSLEDFKNYKKNPIAFKPSATAAKSPTALKNEKTAARAKPQKPLGTQEPFYESSQEVSFPIPIRPNIVVHLVGVPNDLTKREAAKIANVVVALAEDDGK